MTLENPPTLPAGAERAATPRPTRRTARFLVLLVTVLLVGNAILGDRGYLSMIRAADEMEQLSRSIAAARARNDALRENARQLREEAWRIEELARGELGLMRPGEKLFIVTDRAPATDRPPAAAADASEPVGPAPPERPALPAQP